MMMMPECVPVSRIIAFPSLSLPAAAFCQARQASFGRRILNIPVSARLQAELQQAAGELRAQLAGVEQERDSLSSRVAQLQEELAQAQLSPEGQEGLAAVCQERDGLRQQLQALEIELTTANEAAQVAAAERDRLADAHRDAER